MYVADKNGGSGSGDDIYCSAIYPERVVTAQNYRYPPGWQNNNMRLPRQMDYTRPVHNDFETLTNPREVHSNPFLEYKWIFDESIDKEYQERVCKQFYPEAISELRSGDKKICADACSKLDIITSFFPEMVQKEIIPLIINNLSNTEAGNRYLFNPIFLPIDFHKIFDIRPACLVAQDILVRLGSFALPALKQALLSSDAQIREKARAIISEIEKKEVPISEKTVPQDADKTTQAPVDPQSSDLVSNNDKSVMPKTTSGLLAEIAFSKGAEGLRSLLAASNININEKDDNGVTALMYAASNADAKTVDILLSAGANIEAKDANWQTALFYATSNGNIETAKTLIEKGLDVNSRNIGLETPLIKAAFEGHVETVKFLISLGAKINDTNIDMQTALMAAAYNGRVETVRALLSLGADRDMKDNKGLTALDFAREANRREVVELLSTAIK